MSAGDRTQGVRVWEWKGGLFLDRGEFARTETGTWQASTPNGLLANLGAHQVTEHEDGSITVSPSIECGVAMKQEGDRQRIDPSKQPYWHGFLDRGVWREV